MLIPQKKKKKHPPQKTKHQTALNAQKKKSGQSLGGSGKPWKESDQRTPEVPALGGLIRNKSPRWL